MENILWLIPLFPLLGFLITGAGFRLVPARLSGWLASGMILVSFILSLVLFSGLPGGRESITFIISGWINTGDFDIPIELLADQLTVMMLLIITGIGFIIHVYSIGYMRGDEGYNRFFAFMNLFVFFMLILVLGGNYLIMFVGWEGVGLCSYFLIGFWNKNNDYNNAARKAFIMNRIGDLGFLLGMFLIYVTFGSLSFKVVFQKAMAAAPGSVVITGLTLLLFTGATGKSAQIPLLTWLPDAMAGPTPVSALIHAATMVTAGIYLVARSNILYALAPLTMNIIAMVAVATSLLAALIALYQTDIKKVLAYSTISQLGLMFLGFAAGSFAGTMFHLMTHAFFKSLLFLAAGSIIHSLAGEQDLRKMGGLRNKIRPTRLVFLAGALAISGIPPFSGFFSKDEILAASLGRSPLFWTAGVLVSIMTAAYTFRIFWLAFYDGYRGERIKLESVHEAPLVMLLPLYILALLSVIGAIPFVLHFPRESAVASFLEPVFHDGLQILHLNHLNVINTSMTPVAIALIFIILSIWLTYRLFIGRNSLPPAETSMRGPFSRFAYGKFYIDELYNNLIIRPLFRLSSFLHDVVETKVLDNIVESTGKFVLYAGSRIRLAQTGNVGFYLFAMVISIIIVLLLNMLR